MNRLFLGLFLASAVSVQSVQPQVSASDVFLNKIQAYATKEALVPLTALAVGLGALIYFREHIVRATPAVQHQVVLLGLDNDTNLSFFSEKVAACIRNNSVCGVILCIDCHGGNAADFSVVHDLIKKLSAKKPVVCLVMGAAYSGGYWAASAANYIFAHSGSGIGSIGVIATVKKHSNVKLNSDMLADVETHIFTAGKYKGVCSPYSGELTQEHKKYIQDGIDLIYQDFVRSVAANRNIDATEHLKWADAQDFNSSQALSLGLIDAIGTIFEAEEKMAELLSGRKGIQIAVADLDFRNI